MPLLQTSDTLVDYLVTGSGEPVTVFAHGLAGAIDETRPFGSGVRGTRVFLHFRGHGASSAPETPWTYEAVAAELLAVADHVGATRALGVSLGAGSMLRAATGLPDRFERLVLVLPATIDRPRRDAAVARMQQLAAHVEAGDVEAVSRLLLLEQPQGARDRADVAVWSRRQARRLMQTSVARGLRELPLQYPIDDRAKLGAVRSHSLVIGQRGDDAHPASTAEELADALPNSRLAMFDAGGVLWTHRRELRSLIGGFLNADDGGRD
ncbi:MAG: alpha/beta fold hydrolase [Nocardioidaceae bacterium]